MNFSMPSLFCLKLSLLPPIISKKHHGASADGGGIARWWQASRRQSKLSKVHFTLDGPFQGILPWYSLGGWMPFIGNKSGYPKCRWWVKWVSIYIDWLHLASYCNVQSSALPDGPKGSEGDPDYIFFTRNTYQASFIGDILWNDCRNWKKMEVWRTDLQTYGRIDRREVWNSYLDYKPFQQDLQRLKGQASGILNGFCIKS